jgi:hypothetical protein
MGQQSTTSFGFALNSVAAAGADVAAADGLITFTGLGSFVYENIQVGVGIQAYVAPVGRVQTLTCAAPAAVGEVYTVNIEQPQPGGGTFRETIYVSSVTGSTANTMAAALDAAIDAYILSGQLLGTAAVAAAVVTTTGATTAPMLRIVGASANITVATTTAGTVGVNTVSQMTALNIENYLATNNYTTVSFQYNSFGASINNEATTGTYIYAINEGDADAADLVTKVTELFNGLNPGAATANPNLISKR